MDQDREVRERNGRGANPAKVRRREYRAVSRDPDSNIVLGIGRSASLSEPAGFDAISHEIHAADRDIFFSFLTEEAVRDRLRDRVLSRTISLVGKKKYAIVCGTVTGVATPPRQKRDRTVGDGAGKAHRKINRVKRVQKKIREEVHGEWRMTSEQSAQRFIRCGDRTRYLF